MPLIFLSIYCLSLNSFKTEFMLIGNSRQLSKIENSTLSLPDNVYVKPVSSARNLGVIFELLFLNLYTVLKPLNVFTL